MQKFKQKPERTRVQDLPAHSLFVRDSLRSLMTSSDPYLNSNFLRKFSIKMRPLDFHVGSSQIPRTKFSRTEPFFEPYPFQKMKDAVEENKPWLERSRFDGSSSVLGTLDLSSTWSPGYDDWWNAKDIVDLLDRYLTYNNIENIDRFKAFGVLDKTDWLGIQVPPESGLNIQNDSVKWSVSRLWMWEGTNPSQPHLSCALQDRTPLRHDTISVPEMRTILTLSGMRALEKDHWHRKAVPIHVVSVAGKKLRILVGVVDSGKGSIEVYKGPIIDFSQGEQPRDNYKEWITTLCWIAGKPVGKTD